MVLCDALNLDGTGVTETQTIFLLYSWAGRARRAAYPNKQHACDVTTGWGVYREPVFAGQWEAHPCGGRKHTGEVAYSELN